MPIIARCRRIDDETMAGTIRAIQRRKQETTMTINLKRLSAVAAGVVLTATVGVATPSLAYKDVLKQSWHADGSVTETRAWNHKNGRGKITQTTDANGNVTSHASPVHVKH
jgi:hypothetical protein